MHSFVALRLGQNTNRMQVGVQPPENYFDHWQSSCQECLEILGRNTEPWHCRDLNEFAAGRGSQLQGRRRVKLLQT
jgi:hypothetical protein